MAEILYHCHRLPRLRDLEVGLSVCLDFGTRETIDLTCTTVGFLERG